MRLFLVDWSGFAIPCKLRASPPIVSGQTFRLGWKASYMAINRKVKARKLRPKAEDTRRAEGTEAE
ncbi:hypothetical protein AMTR_s00042p00230980, partial [Amborella trichopoda]